MTGLGVHTCLVLANEIQLEVWWATVVICSPYYNNKIHEKKLFFCLLTYLHKDVMSGSAAVILQWWGDRSECECQHAKDGRAERLKEPRSFLTLLTHYELVNPGTTLLLDFSLQEIINLALFKILLGGSSITEDQNQPR